MPEKTLHICYIDKFIPGFIEFVRNEVGGSNNHFYLIGDKERYPYREGRDTEYQASKLGYLKLFFKLQNYDRIILHGLFNKYVVFALALQPALLERCYWVMWGGDLYSYEKENKGLKKNLVEKCRRRIIKNIGHLVTYIPGDVELARKWYGARGDYIECLMYPSNLYKPLELPQVVKKDGSLTALVGNSASTTNNHFEAFQKLAALGENNMRVVCPLSYGKAAYAEAVIAEGQKLFGGNFEPLRDFLPLDDYLQLLGEVDIAIFAHRRQQAMGNIITLIGLGKKVYMRQDITPWPMLEELGITLFDMDELDTMDIEQSVAMKNSAIVKDYFSKEKLIRQLESFL